MAVTTNDRISHAKVYLEPALYSVIQRVAEKDSESLSSWLRKLIIQELLKRGEVSTELLVRLASG